VGDAALHHLLAHIQINLAWRTAHVAKVSICHLSRAINDATHDGNCDTCSSMKRRTQGLQWTGAINV
jgi:hypothetical protein